MNKKQKIERPESLDALIKHLKETGEFYTCTDDLFSLYTRKIETKAQEDLNTLKKKGFRDVVVFEMVDEMIENVEDIQHIYNKTKKRLDNYDRDYISIAKRIQQLIDDTILPIVEYCTAAFSKLENRENVIKERSDDMTEEERKKEDEKEEQTIEGYLRNIGEEECLSLWDELQKNNLEYERKEEESVKLGKNFSKGDRVKVTESPTYIYYGILGDSYNETRAIVKHVKMINENTPDWNTFKPGDQTSYPDYQCIEKV